MPLAIFALVMVIGGLTSLTDQGMPRAARNAKAIGRLGGVFLALVCGVLIAPAVAPALAPTYKGPFPYVVLLPYLFLAIGEIYARWRSDRIINAVQVRVTPLSSSDPS